MRAAAAQFSSAEFSEVNMEAIAGEAGLSPAAIYNHFASKEDLFAATTIHMTQVNLDAFRSAIDDALTSGAGWRAALAAVLRLIAEDATGWMRYPLLVPATQLKMLQKRELFGDMLAMRREYARQFERIIDAAIAQDDLPDTLPVALGAQLLMGFVFNGMGAVISHSASEAEIGAIVDAAGVLLGVGPVMQAKAPGSAAQNR
jgi:AcrR family transcriptional regulator